LNHRLGRLRGGYGIRVTYPTKCKRLRVTFAGSALREGHATIRSNEGLAMGHELPHHFICNADLMVLADCAPPALVGSPRRKQTALRAKQLALGSHEPTTVKSRWPNALYDVAPSSMWAVPRREEAGPLRGDLPPYFLACGPMAGAWLSRLAASSRRRPRSRR
jgi:hypothetical protein